MKKFRFSAGLCAVLLMSSGLECLPVLAGNARLYTERFTSYAQYEAAVAAGSPEAVSHSAAVKVTETLPSAFDLRSRGLVTSVKAQKNYGICWSFSAMNSLETQLIAKNPEIDLSEWHLAYYTYSPVFGFSLASMTDMDDVFQQGGNYYLLSPPLTNWTGPVEESLFPFEDYDVLNPEAEQEEVRAQAAYHVCDTNLYGYDMEDENFPEQMEAIKQAIYQNNAFSMCYYNNNAYYNSRKYAYYNYGDKLTGGTYHAVSVVGWDDDFPASSFSVSPEHNGAWLVKNSWGETWGDCGYFWISYYDPTMVDFYYLKAEPLSLHDDMYVHDDYGVWATILLSSEEDSAYIANVFTAEKDTFLTSVMFCTSVPEEAYEIQIFTNPESTNPASGKGSSVTSGTTDAPGYHTINLEDAVELHEGEKFSVVIKLSGASGQYISCEAYTESRAVSPAGAVSAEQGRITEEMLFRNFSGGESFFSPDGKDWNDIYYEAPITDDYIAEDGTAFSSRIVMGNICIRALTKNTGAIIFSEEEEAVPAGTEIALSSPSSSEIWYSIDGGEYQLYTEPLIMPEQEMQISAFAVIGTEKQPLFEKVYTVQEAKISSLLAVQNQKKKYYLSFEKTADQKYETEISSYNPAEMFSLMPISTGEILSDGEWLVSGSLAQVVPDRNGIVSLSVSQEGCLDTVYEIHFPVEKEILYGDADNDGKVNAADAAEVLVYASAVGSGTEPELPDDEWLLRADYDADGEVNAYDASEILVYAAKQGTGG